MNARPQLLRPEPTRSLLAPRDEGALSRAYGRVAGAELRQGNRVELLRDGSENYPAWLKAIEGARQRIHFENFIVANDAAGRRFADALIERAQAGVAVRVHYDWLGCCGRAGPGFWRRLREGGVEVRAFNPPQLAAPLWFQRTHRKLITVDGRLGFVSGLCVAECWQGGRDEPWRDTGLSLEGPAVADLDAAFADTWSLSGDPLPADVLRPHQDDQPAGRTSVRVVAGRPYQLSIYRLDQLVAAAAQHRLWLTDAYFVATAAYVQALTEAARDGVDVRLLVPGNNDVPLLQNVVRPGYRPLIEAGVRVYEWTGSMLHAKTAVADGRWARVGSTNLNATSWLTNYELDVAVEDENFAAAMEAMFLEDLARSNEVVLTNRARSYRTPQLAPRATARTRARAGIARLAGGAVGLTRMAGAAVAGRRLLSAAEAKSAVTLGAALLGLAALITLFPVLVVSPVVLALAWFGMALLLRAWRLRRAMRALERRRPPPFAGARPAAEC